SPAGRTTGSTESRGPPAPTSSQPRRTPEPRDRAGPARRGRSDGGGGAPRGPVSFSGLRGAPPPPSRCLRFDDRPGLVDPGVRRGRLALGPTWRRRDVSNRDGDDTVRVEDRERVLRHVLAEADDRLLVALVVVRPDVDVA